ncbi:hypothetical protein BDV18DRAFT_3414 [Aspergillus unguis]
MSLEVPIDTSAMSFDEKAKEAEVSPVSSVSQQETQDLADQHHELEQAPTNTNTIPNTPNLAALESLVVLPKILQEGILLVASGPALLLQAAHPAVATPSANLSKELTSTTHATLSYIACLVFGTKEEKASLLGRIRIRQASLESKNPSQSTLATPAAKLWLVATLYASATDFYQRVYGGFDYRTAEAAYEEFSLVLRHLSPTVLPHDSGLWPPSRTGFWKYWDEQVDSLVVSNTAQDVAKDLSTRDLPSGYGITRPVLRAVTIEMLPETVRNGYGLKSSVVTKSVYAAALGLIKPVYPCIPKTWRSGPVKYYLSEVRGEISS